MPLNITAIVHINLPMPILSLSLSVCCVCLSDLVRCSSAMITTLGFH